MRQLEYKTRHNDARDIVKCERIYSYICKTIVKVQLKKRKDNRT